VVLLAMMLKPDMVNLAASPPSVIKSLLLWPQMTDPHLGVGWSLVYEMYFYLVFALGLLLLQGRLFYGFCAWVLALSVCAHLGIYHTTSNAVLKVMTSPYGLEFLMGCAAAWCWKRGFMPRPSLLIMAAMLWAGMAAFLVLQAVGTLVLYFEATPRALMVGIPTALMMLALLQWERDGKLRYPRWLCAIGDASYSLYLLHSLLFSAMGKLWLHLHADGFAAQTAYSMLMLLTAVMLALLNYRYIEKPLSRWYHKRLVE